MNTHFAIALHALALLHHENASPLSAVFIAASVGTNPVFMRRVLRDLQRADLIEIKRGVEGGASLARPADRITLAEVYLAVFGRGRLLAIHEAPSPRCQVGQGVATAFTDVAQNAEDALLAHLRDETIADFHARTQCTEPAQEK